MHSGPGREWARDHEALAQKIISREQKSRQLALTLGGWPQLRIFIEFGLDLAFDPFPDYSLRTFRS
jgi:hypothetical protein